MTITPNRQGLRNLANFSIDEQFCQQYGGKVFNYAGEITPVYQRLCEAFSTLIDHMISEMHAIKNQIPGSGLGVGQDEMG